MSKWVRFEQRPAVRGRKTAIYFVINKAQNAALGEVLWYAPWRQYVFLPKPATLYARSCLAEIEHFIAGLMNEREVCRVVGQLHGCLPAKRRHGR